MDDVERQSPGFSVEPFEPSLVPIAGDYEMLYYDEIGQPLPPPRGKALLRFLPRGYGGGQWLVSVRIGGASADGGIRDRLSRPE